MKALYKALAAVVILAPLYALGCVGSFEAGHLSMLGLFVNCGAAWAALWASIQICSKIERSGRNDRDRAQGEKQV